MRNSERDVSTAEHRMIWAPWSPAQIVALALGVLYLILGAIALAQAGINADTFAQKQTSVLGFHHTALLGVIELVFGLLLLLAGAAPGAGRSTMAFLGALALAFGFVVLAQAASLSTALGVQNANGWLYIVTGAATLFAALAAPVIFQRERRVSEHRDSANPSPPSHRPPTS